MRWLHKPAIVWYGEIAIAKIRNLASMLEIVTDETKSVSCVEFNPEKGLGDLGFGKCRENASPGYLDRPKGLSAPPRSYKSPRLEIGRLLQALRGVFDSSP